MLPYDDNGDELAIVLSVIVEKDGWKSKIPQCHRHSTKNTVMLVFLILK
jgi:hypothetical protein